MKLPKITLEEFMELDLGCSREQVEALMTGRKSVDALEILASDFTATDKLWAVLRADLIPANILHEFACQCAEEGFEPKGKPDLHYASKIWGSAGDIWDVICASARVAARAATQVPNASWVAWYAAWGSAFKTLEGILVRMLQEFIMEDKPLRRRHAVWY